MHYSHPNHYAHYRYQAAWNRRLVFTLILLWPFVVQELTGETWPVALFFSLVIPAAVTVVAILLAGIIWGFIPSLWRWLKGY